MAESPEDSRRALYERFYKYVGRDVSPQADDGAYFDEDDIIEIYDYANDMNDDFIKMEALFYGARMFPRSEALRTRRDYLYYYLGNDDAVRLLLERRSQATTLSRLLAMRARTDRGEDTQKELEQILVTTSEMDDEEIIQFVAEASTPENYSWLATHIEELKKHCSYLPTLYYELAGAAEDNQDYPMAIAMAEELTMLEPFNLEYWELLAELQHAGNDDEGALTSLDYAMAIDPLSVKSKTLRAEVLYARDPRSTEAIDLLMSVCHDDKMDSVSMRTLAVLLTNCHRADEAISLLEDFLKRDPADPVILDCLFILNEPRVPDYIEELRKSGAEADLSTSVWLDWSARHMSAERYNVAAELLLEAHRRGKLDGNEPLLAEALYLAGRFAEIFTFFQTLPDYKLKFSPEMSAVLVMTLVRLGRKDDALEYARSFVDITDRLNTVFDSEAVVTPIVSRNFYRSGVREIFNNIISALSSAQELPVDDFDPLKPRQL